MAARIALLACLLGSVPAAARESDPKEDPGFLREVKGAIEGGVGWLLAQQATNGTFPGFEDPRGVVYGLGMHSLATLAVIKGGHPQDSPEVFKALRQMRRLYDRNRAILKTYEVGLTLMVLEAKYFAEPPFTDRRQRRGPKRRNPKIEDSDRAWAAEMSLWLQTKQRPPGLWRYPELGMDLSNTQYAALGLWAAHKLGAPIDPGVVRRMLEETMARQQKEGRKVPFILDPELHRRSGERRSTTMIDARGWRYMPPETLVGPDGRTRTVTYPYSGSMTSAGIAILAIGRDILGEDDLWLDAARDRKLRRAMWEGFGWIQANWDLEDNPGQPGNWPFYWLYGLERCCRLAGLEYVGPHDWYLMGAKRLIVDQREDGSWPKTQRMRPPDDQNVRWWSDQVDTAFAVLFLVRGTPELDIPPPTITGGGD